MSPIVYELIVYMVEALMSGIFMLNLLQAKYYKPLQLALWCEIVFLIILFTPSYSLIRIGFIAVAELIFTLFLYENKIKERISLFVFKEVVVLLSSALSFGIYSGFINDEAKFAASCTSENCTYCLLYLINFSILISILFQFVKRARGVELPWVIGTQVVVGFGESAAILAVAKASSNAIDSQESGLIVVASVCMVAANISIGTLAPYLLRKISMSNNIDYGKELSNMEYKYYEMSVENDKKLLSIKHDISNHIQTVYSLLKNGENQRGMELINELKDRYMHVEPMLYCKNPVLNIILANKKREAEEWNIETHIKVKDELDGLPITDFDLSTVVCNLADNAIRGCINSEQSHPRFIIEILQKNQYLVIRILNSCKVSMNVENTDRIDTTKSNSQTHGFGMPIVAGIAKKYRGDFVVSAQNGIFTATVVMSMKK